MASVRAVGASVCCLALGACGIGGGGHGDATVFPIDSADAGFADAAVEPDAGRPADSGVVSTSSFCWVNEPQGATLAAVWGITAGDAWAVGSPSLALHYDGQRWTRTPTPGIQRFVSAWASGSQDVWLLGKDGAVLRGNQAGFSTSLAEGVSSWRMWIRGAGPNDVWAGLYHWDGATWTKTAGPKSIGDNSEEMLAWPLGDGTAYGIYWQPFSEGFSECARWDGTSWRSDPCPGDQPEALWASGPDDLWTTGYPAGHWNDMGGYVQSGLQWRSHFDGAQWHTETFTRSPDGRPQISGTGPSDVWFTAPGAHFDGTAVRPIIPPDGTTISAIPGGKAFALSGDGKVSLGDGKTWQTLLDVEPGVSVTAEIAGERIGVTGQRLVRLEAGRWVTLARAQAPFSRAEHLFGSALDDLWVVSSDSAAYHWDGTRWSAFANPVPSGSFWGRGSAARGRVWFISREQAYIEGVSTDRFRLLVKDPGSAIKVVRALGEDQVWGVQAFASGETLAFATRMLGPGYANFIRVLWRHDGTRWTEVWHDSPNYGSDGWGPISGNRDPTDVWAWASAPSPGDGYWWRDLRHWDGTSMQSVRAVRGDQGEVTAVVGPGEVWISTHDRDGFRRATLAGIEEGTFVQLPATARELWRLPGGRIQALSDAAAVWELRPSCAAQEEETACRFSFSAIETPPGFRYYDVRGLNEHDAVLVQAQNADGANEPYIRRADGTFVRLGVPEGATGRVANGFNDLEQVVGYDSDPSGRGRGTAFVWNAGATYPLEAPDLATLAAIPECAAPTPELVNCEALGINNRGIAVGDCYPSCGWGLYAARWQDRAVTLLPQPSHHAGASSITDSGVIAGGFDSEDFRVGPGGGTFSSGGILWRGGSYQLFSSPDADESIRVNERGDLLMRRAPHQDPLYAYGPSVAEVREAGGRVRHLQPLPNMPGVLASSINGSGVVVGSSWTGTGGRDTATWVARAVYWLNDEANDLSSLLEGANPPLLEDAWLINDRGRMVARSQQGANSRLWLLTPHGDCFSR